VTLTSLLREARDSDGPGIGALIAGVYAEYPGIVFLDEEFPELVAPASFYRARDGRWWVLEDEGGIFGSIAVARDDRLGAYELFKLYLRRDRRGSGAADALLSQALAFARTEGGQTMILWTDTRFLAGHRFYEKNGFVRGAEERTLGDASKSREYIFRRDLGL